MSWLNCQWYQCRHCDLISHHGKPSWYCRRLVEAVSSPGASAFSGDGICTSFTGCTSHWTDKFAPCRMYVILNHKNKHKLPVDWFWKFYLKFERNYLSSCSTGFVKDHAVDSLCQEKFMTVHCSTVHTDDQRCLQLSCSTNKLTWRPVKWGSIIKWDQMDDFCMGVCPTLILKG